MIALVSNNLSSCQMRILLLTTSFPVNEGSSSGIFVERLAKRLGYECHLDILAPSGDIPTNIDYKKKYKLITFRYAPRRLQILAHKGGGVPAMLASHPWTMILLPLFLLSMFANCLWYAQKTDAIFANWSLCGVIAGVSGLILGKPVITTLRGEDANRASTSMAHLILISLCLRFSRRVVTVSDDIALSLTKMFPTMLQKIVMIPNGVDCLNEHRPFDAIAENDKVQLIIIGSLILRKSISTALKALSLLPLKFSLTIVGDGPERESLRTLAKDLGLEGRVFFVGHVHPDEVSCWLSKSDVLLMTSKSEGRPNAVLEAMAAGLPVVGSDIPGLRELILPEVNGMLFPFGEFEVLASSISLLADQELRQRLGEGGRRFIKESGLTWENTADKYLHEFRQLCSKGIS